MAKIGSVGKALLGPLGSALVTGKFDMANSLPGVLLGAKTREEKRALREKEEEEKGMKAGEGMKRGGKAKAKTKKYAKGGMVKKAGGGAMQGPPTSTASSAPRGDTYDENRLTNLNPPHSSRTTSDFSVRPAIKGGKPGIKVKGSFAKGGKVSSASKRADGCATKGKTKGRFV